jgi:hypothetical protein
VVCGTAGAGGSEENEMEENAFKYFYFTQNERKMRWKKMSSNIFILHGMFLKICFKNKGGSLHRFRHYRAAASVGTTYYMKIWRALSCYRILNMGKRELEVF